MRVRVTAGEGPGADGELVLPASPAGVVALFGGGADTDPRVASAAAELAGAGFATLALDPPPPGDPAASGVDVVRWLGGAPELAGLSIGLFGAGTGAAAALAGAAAAPAAVDAVVARGGRLDLVSGMLRDVRAPTLLVVAHDDAPVLGVNTAALRRLGGPVRLHVLPGPAAGGGPDPVDEAAVLARDWFRRHLRRRGPA